MLKTKILGGCVLACLITAPWLLGQTDAQSLIDAHLKNPPVETSPASIGEADCLDSVSECDHPAEVAQNAVPPQKVILGNGPAAIALPNDDVVTWVQGPDPQNRLRYYIPSSDDGQSPAKDVSIKTVDGRVEVKVNGKVIPNAVVQLHDGELVILNADGSPVESVKQPSGVVIDLGGTSGGPTSGFTWGPDSMIEYGVAGQASQGTRFIIGINMGPVSPVVAGHLGLNADDCFMITEVLDGYPAKAAGLKENDIITSIEGSDSASGETLRAVLRRKSAGDRVEIGLLRKGRPLKVRVGVQQYPAARGTADPTAPDVASTPGGLKVRPKLEWFGKGIPGYTPLDSTGTFSKTAPKNEQLDRIEKRLKRLESMLEKLLEAEPRRRRVKQTDEEFFLK